MNGFTCPAQRGAECCAGRSGLIGAAWSSATTSHISITRSMWAITAVCWANQLRDRRRRVMRAAGDGRIGLQSMSLVKRAAGSCTQLVRDGGIGLQRRNQARRRRCGASTFRHSGRGGSRATREGSQKSGVGSLRAAEPISHLRRRADARRAR